MKSYTLHQLRIKNTSSPDRHAPPTLQSPEFYTCHLHLIRHTLYRLSLPALQCFISSNIPGLLTCYLPEHSVSSSFVYSPFLMDPSPANRQSSFNTPASDCSKVPVHLFTCILRLPVSVPLSK